MQLHLFPIDFPHRKLLTASVYIAIALLLPPASIVTSFFFFFFIHFNIRYFVVLRKTGTIARTIVIERGVSHKKEVCVAFGVISDTARREIGFNAFFFAFHSKKKKIGTSRHSRFRHREVFLDSCCPCHRNFTVSIISEVTTFPRGLIFLFHLFLF